MNNYLILKKVMIFLKHIKDLEVLGMAKKVPVTIAIDADLLAEIDDMAGRMGLSRSSYVSLLLSSTHADPMEFLKAAAHAMKQQGKESDSVSGEVATA